MSICKTTRIILLFAALASAALPQLAYTQSIGLAPAQIVETFRPGVPFTQELTVANDGSSPAELHVQITDFWYDEQNEKVFTRPGTSPRSAANWIQFVPETVVVAPNSSQKLKAIVTPPADAVGGYYAVLFVESKPVQTNKVTADGKAVFANMRIGCLVLLAAKDTETYKVSIDDLKITPPSPQEPLTASFVLHNQSNTHLFPTARMAVFDADHKLIAKSESAMKRFLPGQKDAMKVQWTGMLPSGSLSAVLTLVSGNHVETRVVPFTVESDSSTTH